MEKHIDCVKNDLKKDKTLSEISKWELLKYEIRKFTINFSKLLARESRKEKCILENKLRNLESDVSNKKQFEDYQKCKADLESIYENIANGQKICSKCNWYQYGEKSSKIIRDKKK